MSRRKHLPEILTSEQIAALDDAMDAAITGARTPKKRLAALRDGMMAFVGFFAGLRVSEIVNLDVPDIDLQTPQLFVRGGKGDRDRYVPLAGPLAEGLRIWIGERKTGPLFLGPNGRRLAARTFQTRLAALGKKARVPKRVHPHLMRHSFATKLLHAGSTIVAVQELLGHASIETTSIYLHVTTKQLKADVDRL